MTVSARVGVVTMAVSLSLPVSRAAAQSVSPGPWEVEVHAAGLFPGNPSDGTSITQFPIGTPIFTGGGPTSRAVSTWYFGDGAVLLNQVNSGLGVSARVTALDPALKVPFVHRQKAGAFGVRVGRELTSRLSAEVNVDYTPGGFGLVSDARTAVEAARATFVTAWNGLIATGATTNRDVTAASTIDEGDAPQVSVTGALKIRLTPGRRLVPYAVAGAGSIFHRGTLPSATLTGDYAFRFGGVAPVNEHDSVTIRVEQKDRAFVGLVGGGVEYHVKPRHGVRGDVRFHVSSNRMNTVVSASPSVAMQAPAFAVSTPFTPSIQFSNDSRLNRPSSLTGPPIADLRTFTGSGVRVDTHLAVGYFVRF